MALEIILAKLFYPVQDSSRLMQSDMSPDQTELSIDSQRDDPSAEDAESPEAVLSIPGHGFLAQSSQPRRRMDTRCAYISGVALQVALCL